jgi:mono/diheme cytochrome c family protein
VIHLVVGLGALTSVLSAALGLLRAGDGEYEPASLNEHRWYGIGVTAASVAAYWLLKAHRAQPLRVWWLGAYRGVLVASIVLLIITGHLGGNLTHGSNYLREGAPAFIKAMLAEESYGVVEAVPSDKQQQYFLEQVRPIFEAKCYSCHGMEKQRGDYRLDDPQIARKGGESGEVAIKPGDPLGSHLVRLILLPPEHDDVMPPSGKLALTPEEIGRVIQWIKTGAVFPGENAKTAVVPATEPASIAP